MYRILERLKAPVNRGLTYKGGSKLNQTLIEALFNLRLEPWYLVFGLLEIPFTICLLD